MAAQSLNPYQAFEKKKPLGPIALFIETGGPGGAEKVVFHLACEYKHQGIEVVVITLREGWLTESLDEARIPRELLTSTGSLDVGLPFRLAKILRKRGVKILHSHLLDSNFYGALAARIAGIAHVGTEHGDVHHPSIKKRFLSTKIRVMSALGTRLIAVSQFSADRLKELGYRPTPLVITNPIDTATFIPVDSAAQKDLRLSLGIPNDVEWVWLHVANLRPVKDQATLIRGFARSSLEGPIKQCLVIVGDGGQKESLVKLTQELGVTETVIFAGFQSDPTCYFQAADGFILSSLSEALPLSILEAAAAGLVVISSSVGGVPALVSKDRGFLFPRANDEALAKRIVEVMKDKTTARRMSKSFQDFVLETCSPQAVAKQHLEIYAGEIK